MNLLPPSARAPHSPASQRTPRGTRLKPQVQKAQASDFSSRSVREGSFSRERVEDTEFGGGRPLGGRVNYVRGMRQKKAKAWP